MLPLHKLMLSKLGGADRARPVFLDTPAAFQENIDRLAQRAESYFRDSLGLDIAIARWKDYVDPYRRPEFLATLAQGNYVVAGPGSPSFALRAWRDTEIPSMLRRLVRAGGALVFSSAAAVTLGAFSVPVYEIFKVGEDPHWIEGLDLLAEVGLDVAVVPHYDNREGNDFDTRFCYLGEKRFLAMEELLPPKVAVLGLDEHTGCIIDATLTILSVVGSGSVTFGRGARRQQFWAHSPVDLTTLSDWTHPYAEEGGQSAPFGQAAVKGQPRAGVPSAGSDVEALVRSALGTLENCEPLPNEESAKLANRSKEFLDRTIAQLGLLARKYEEPQSSKIEPLVEALVDIREGARKVSDWSLADRIRDTLKSVGVEVRDTSSGPEWRLDVDAGSKRAGRSADG